MDIVGTPFPSANQFLNDDRKAAQYVQTRYSDLQALYEDLKSPDNGYARLTRTASGIQIKTKRETLLAVSFVAAQAYILARFW